jgi:quercetin dioxygenase-like cupin family protein
LNRSSLFSAHQISQTQLNGEKEMLRVGKGVVLTGMAVTAVLAYGGTAQAEPTPPAPVVTEVLTPRATFTDDASMQVRLKVDGHGTNVIKTTDLSHIVTNKVTVQPGGQIPWHTHHGPVFVTVVEGELTYLSSEGCTSHRYGAGSAFVDPGHGHVHMAFDSGTTPTVFVATFFEVPEGTAPVGIPAQPPANCKAPTS